MSDQDDKDSLEVNNAGTVSALATSQTPASRRPHWPWLLATLFLISGLFVWSLDELPPDVSDFAIEHLNLKDEENAYVLLKQAGEDATKALSLSTEDEKLFGSMADGEDWDNAKVEAWLAAVEPLWPRYEKAAHTLTSEIPAEDLLTRKSSVIRPLNKLIFLSHLRAQHALRQGRSNDAINDALLAIRAGQRLEQSRGALLEVVVSAGAKLMTLDLIEKIIRDPNVSDEALRALIPALDNLENKEALDYAARATFDEGVFWLGKFEREGYDAVLGPSDGWRHLAPFAASVPVLYKRNKTVRFYAQELRAIREVIHSNSAEIRQFKKPHKYEYVGQGVRAWNPDNLFGRKILNQMEPSTLLMPNFRLRPGSKAGAVQALAAVLLYQRQHGSIPPSLDELIPQYLTAVPRDFFDDAPLRYSAELGVIWSTGSDGLIVKSRDQEIVAREVVVWVIPPPPKPEKPSDGFGN